MNEVFLLQSYSCWDDLPNVFLIVCGTKGSKRVGIGGEVGRMGEGRDGMIYMVDRAVPVACLTMEVIHQDHQGLGDMRCLDLEHIPSV